MCTSCWCNALSWVVYIYKCLCGGEANQEFEPNAALASLYQNKEEKKEERGDAFLWSGTFGSIITSNLRNRMTMFHDCSCRRSANYHEGITATHVLQLSWIRFHTQTTQWFLFVFVCVAMRVQKNICSENVRTSKIVGRQGRPLGDLRFIQVLK